ncbi:hypothetical protein OROMI_024197 [Orobanche minor]
MEVAPIEIPSDHHCTWLFLRYVLFSNCLPSQGYNIIPLSFLSPKITLGAYFVDGPAGSGKTFLYRALLAAARSRHFIALAVASSGVAASLLPGGRTAHSRFKLPIIVEDEACTISKQSVHARVIVAAKLIIWDEASVMVLEPSNCTFKLLMDHINEIESYNGGDQGYLNEIFTWWHGIPKHMNFLKHFWVGDDEVVRKKKIHLFEAEPPVLYVLHYLGNKPWMCFKDYDCNWNVNILQEFASDAAHRRWWKVHDEMPERLKEHCLLKTLQKAQLEWDIREAEKGNYSDGHWRIGIKDERLMRCIDKDCSWRGKLRHWVVKNPPHSATVSAAAYLSPKRAGLYANFV